jgi:cation transport regulator
MPYRTMNELPESVQKHLPKHACEIYMKAFNSAWEQYDQCSGQVFSDTKIGCPAAISRS